MSWRKISETTIPSSAGAITLADLTGVLAPAFALLGGQLDLSLGGVTTAKIADFNVTNAKVGLLAVDDANIANLSAIKITAGTFVAGVVYAGNINAIQIITGTLQIGFSGASAIVDIRDGSNTPIGWIGSKFNGSTWDNGAWFQTCRVGGSSYTTAPLQVDSSGVLSINISGTGYSGGTTTVTLGGSLGYISVAGTSPSRTTYYTADQIAWIEGFGVSAITMSGSGAILTGFLSGDFANLTIASVAVATQSYVTTRGYLTVAVTSAVAGNGIAVSGATGAVTFSIDTTIVPAHNVPHSPALTIPDNVETTGSNVTPALYTTWILCYDTAGNYKGLIPIF